LYLGSLQPCVPVSLNPCLCRITLQCLRELSLNTCDSGLHAPLPRWCACTTHTFVCTSLGWRVHHVWMYVHHLWMYVHHVWMYVHHVWMYVHHVWMCVHHVWMHVHHVWMCGHQFGMVCALHALAAVRESRHRPRPSTVHALAAASEARHRPRPSTVCMNPLHKLGPPIFAPVTDQVILDHQIATSFTKSTIRSKLRAWSGISQYIIRIFPRPAHLRALLLALLQHQLLAKGALQLTPAMAGARRAVCDLPEHGRSLTHGVLLHCRFRFWRQWHHWEPQ